MVEHHAGNSLDVIDACLVVGVRLGLDHAEQDRLFVDAEGGHHLVALLQVAHGLDTALQLLGFIRAHFVPLVWGHQQLDRFLVLLLHQVQTHFVGVSVFSESLVAKLVDDPVRLHHFGHKIQILLVGLEVDVSKYYLELVASLSAHVELVVELCEWASDAQFLSV